jgi:PAS domain S-box-containing protein
MSSTDHLSELESLRSQVADLVRALAERDQAILELQRCQPDSVCLENERHLRFTQCAVDRAEDGILWADDSKRFIYANAAACRLLGYSNEELLTLSISDIAPYHDPARFQQRLDQIKQGAAATYESIHRRKDGTEFPVEASVTYLEYEGRGYTCGVVRDITERKHIEQERLEALHDLQSIFEAVPDIMFTLDTQGNMVKWNRRVGEVTGYSPEELLNKPALAFVPPDQQTRTAAAIQRAFTEGYAELEGHLLTKDHRLIPYHWTGALLKNSYGEPVGITGIGRDVSVKKRVEEALRQSEQRFTLAIEGANDILWDAHRLPDEPWHAPQTPIWWSPRVRELLGLGESESFETLEQWSARLHPDDKDRVFGQLAAHVEQRVPFDAEYRLCTNRGDYLWVRGRGQAMWDEQGEPRRMSGSCQDITERKRVEEALHASEERFSLAVFGSNTGIWDWDLRTDKTYFSPLWKKMLGYEDHELKGELFEWEQRLHPDDRERSLATVRAYLSGTTSQYQLEHRLRHKDGSYRWVLARGVSLSDAEGKPYRMAGSHIDITEQTKTQEALAQSERQLRTVLDALPMGVWFTDRSGAPVLSNPVARQIWSGIRQVCLEKVTNTAGWQEATGSSSALHRWALSHTLTTGEPCLNESLILECLDGTKKTIRNSAVPVKDEAGLVLGAIVLNEDITPLRQAQEALRLTQFSVDHAVEGFLWISSDGRIRNVNDAVCRMMEYTRDELTTMTVQDIDPNFPLEAWPAHWEDLKQKGSMRFESKHWSRTGRVLDTEVTVNYLSYEGEEYGCAIMRNIGERKRAEATLRQSEERYRSLVDNAPIGIFVNEAGRFAYANREVQRILKATNAEQLIGTPVLDRIAQEFQRPDEVVKDLTRPLMGNGQSVPLLNEQYVRFDGSRVDVAVTSIPTSFGDTPVTQVLVLDITERKQAEEALRQRELDLRTAIEERERISQDLHDGILQSLFAVGLGLEATKSAMSPTVRKMSGPPLNRAIEQLNRVMHEIRNFIAGLGSDLLQGKGLSTALQQMLSSLTQSQATRVRLALDDRAVRAVSAEQSLHLLHVIQEAVSNCIRHGRAQEARVSLKMLKQGVRLSIRDNGRGFKQDAAKRTGHGLTNMAARAEKLGGRFTILSKVNEGTRIVLDLPNEAANVRH